MILLMVQMQTMLSSVIVFQRPDPNFKLKAAIYCLLVLLSGIPIILSWIFYSDKAVELLYYYYLTFLFGFLTLLLTYFTISVVIQMRRLPRIINNTDQLKQERRNLFIVLTLFDLSYLLRVILNATTYPKAYTG